MIPVGLMRFLPHIAVAVLVAAILYWMYSFGVAHERAIWQAKVARAESQLNSELEAARAELEEMRSRWFRTIAVNSQALKELQDALPALDSSVPCLDDEQLHALNFAIAKLRTLAAPK